MVKQKTEKKRKIIMVIPEAWYEDVKIIKGNKIKAGAIQITLDVEQLNKLNTYIYDCVRFKE